MRVVSSACLGNAQPHARISAVPLSERLSYVHLPPPFDPLGYPRRDENRKNLTPSVEELTSQHQKKVSETAAPGSAVPRCACRECIFTPCSGRQRSASCACCGCRATIALQLAVALHPRSTLVGLGCTLQPVIRFPRGAKIDQSVEILQLDAGPSGGRWLARVKHFGCRRVPQAEQSDGHLCFVKLIFAP